MRINLIGVDLMYKTPRSRFQEFRVNRVRTDGNRGRRARASARGTCRAAEGTYASAPAAGSPALAARQAMTRPPSRCAWPLRRQQLRQHPARPAPASAWPGAEWLGDGSPSLQGWDIYQKMLVDGATGPGAERGIEELVTERLPGLGTLIMEPPRPAFATAGRGWGIQREHFAAAVAAFRRRGVRVVLYSSVVHLGEDAEWASGNLSRQHPEFSQRLRDSSPATLETKPMLSPSSAAAVAYSLNYTLDLLSRFPADGVYLDDNQLGADRRLQHGGERLERIPAARFGQWSAQCLSYTDIGNAPILPPPTTAPWSSRPSGEPGCAGQRTMALSNEAFRRCTNTPAPTASHWRSSSATSSSSRRMFGDELRLYHEDAVLKDYDVEQWTAAKPMLVRARVVADGSSVERHVWSLQLTAKPLFGPPRGAAMRDGASYMTRLKPHFFYGLQQQPPDTAVGGRPDSALVSDDEGASV